MKFIYIIIGLILLMSSVSATDYYVDANTGNDADDGLSLANAWLTLEYADGQLSAGDSLYLVDGTWINDSITFSSSGTFSNPITIRAYNGTPTLDGVDKTVNGHNAIDGGGQSNITISGIKFINWWWILRGFKNDISLKDNYFGATGSTVGVTDFTQYSGTYNVTIDNNTYTRGGWSSIPLTGQQTNSGVVDPVENTCYNYSIINNRFVDNDDTDHSGGIDISGRCTDINIIGNTFDVMETLLYVHKVEDGPRVQRLNFSNNIISHIGNTELEIQGINDSIFMNNIISDSNLNPNIQTRTAGVSEIIRNNTFINTTIYNTTNFPIWIKYGDDIIFERTYVYNYTQSLFTFSYSGTRTIVRDTVNYNYDVVIEGTVDNTVEYTDGKIFSISKTGGAGTYNLADPLYYPTRSLSTQNSTDAGAVVFAIVSHNITFMPTAGYGKEIVVNTDLVDDVSNITANVSEPLTATMTFLVENASNTYNLSVNNVYNQNAVSNSDSIVEFDYTFLSAVPTNFEVAWASTSGWSPEANHIYVGRMVSINSIGTIIHKKTPQQSDTCITSIFNAVVS